jgi:Zn-dependent peptidase ImmA (M78 family)
MNNKIKYIKYAEYREIAHAFLKNVGIDKNNRFPLDLDILIDKAGYRIEAITNLKKDFGVKGCVIKRKGGTFIIGIDSHHYMNEDKYYPFTLAEELGHILAHGYLYEEINSLEDAIALLCHVSDSDYRMMEQQARNVGSNILLPSFLFDPFVLDYYHQHVAEIKKERFYDKWDFADYLAERISKNINISKQPIFYSILKRYPEPLLIDRIVDEIGNDVLF